eukprot:3791087-Amphidinium_carterae.2
MESPSLVVITAPDANSVLQDVPQFAATFACHTLQTVLPCQSGHSPLEAQDVQRILPNNRSMCAAVTTHHL